MGFRRVEFSSNPCPAVKLIEKTIFLEFCRSWDPYKNQVNNITYMYYPSKAYPVPAFTFTNGEKARKFYWHLLKVLEDKSIKNEKVHVHIEHGRFIQKSDFCDQYKIF